MNILIGCHRHVTRAMLQALFGADDTVFIAATPEAFDHALAIEPIDRVFLIFWSWRLSPGVIEKYKPLGFHMTALPYGRGGSPLQNLAESGVTHTELCMLNLNDKLDAGDVVDRQPLCVEGSADEVYARTGLLACQRIRAYLDAGCSWPTRAQEGVPVEFKRRTPTMSELPREGDLDGILRHIRMLDAEGYPHAFVEHGAFTLKLRRATMRDECILADCEIGVTEIEGSSKLLK